MSKSVLVIYPIDFYMYGHFVRKSHTIVNEIIRGYITYASVGLEYLFYFNTHTFSSSS